MKAIGITLVVYGHSEAVPESLKKAIYGFHMPLFFFVSGFLLSRSKLEVAFKTLLSGRIFRLSVDYLIFAIVNYVFWVFLSRRFDVNNTGDLPIGMPLFGIVYGSGSHPSLLQPGVLWFFPCLVSAIILMWITCRMPRIARIAAITVATIAGFHWGGMIMPWELETALMALPFMWAGYAARMAMPRIHALPMVCYLIIFIALASASWYSSAINTRIDMRSGMYGAAHLFAASSVFGILSVMSLAMAMPFCKIAEKVSNATIFIFPLHSAAFILLSGIYAYLFGMPGSFKNEPVVGVIATFFIISSIVLISYPIFPILNKIRNFFLPDKMKLNQ